MTSIDDSTWPLVRVRWTQRVSDTELTTFFTAFAGWLARRERFGLLIDARDALGFNADQRRRVVAFMKANNAQAAALLVQALVHNNAIQRTLTNVMTAILPPPYRTRSFGDVEIAHQWLRDELALSGDRQGSRTTGTPS